MIAKEHKLGRLICLEGIEGTGKTTQTSFVVDYIRRHFNQRVVMTREPGGTLLAESIRHLILDAKKDQEPIAPETELFLLFAARRQHVMQIIQPAIKRGNWVICDRFTEASYAYQGGGRGISSHLIETLESYTHHNLTIDCVILLDMPVKAALDRLHKTRYHMQQPLDRIEIEPFEFFEHVRNSYLDRAQKFPSRYRIIDANVSLKKVQSQIAAVLDELLFVWN